jgi:hypothetical protein
LIISFAIVKNNFRVIGTKSSRGIHNLSSFVIGFVILNLLCIVPIPYFGPVAQVIVTSVGFGAIYYALRKNKSPWSEQKVST